MMPGQGPMTTSLAKCTLLTGQDLSEQPIHTSDDEGLLFQPRLSILHVLSHLVLSITLGNQSYYYSHLIDEETEGQRSCLPRVTKPVNDRNRI